tara:strand:+ start:165 stop:452 length:288 start_codon:yes stop_codon:yes gene_type:complete
LCPLKAQLLLTRLLRQSRKRRRKAIVWNENPLHKDKDKDKGEKGGLELSQMSAGAGEEDCVPLLLRQHEQSIIPACLFYPLPGVTANLLSPVNPG